jgi:plastocyanin
VSSRGLIAVIVAAVVTIGAAAFAVGRGTATDSGSAASATTVAGRAPQGAGAPVAIKNFAFAPPTITVKVGESVTWTNGDSSTHTVHADDGSFASQDLGPGASFTATFSAPGTHAYICAIHTSMKGTVVVEA